MLLIPSIISKRISEFKKKRIKEFSKELGNEGKEALSSIDIKTNQSLNRC